MRSIMTSNYMTRRQYTKHMEQIHAIEDKLSEAKKKVGDAAALGDLSENAEYDAAREEVEFLTTRFQEHQSVLVGMQIVESKRTDPKRVTIGKSVVLRDLSSGEEVTYHIVGAGFADLTIGEVSYRAPLAAGLIGHAAGEEIDVPVPEGSRRVVIVSISLYE